MDKEKEFLIAILGGLQEAYQSASEDEKQELLRLNGHNLEHVRNRGRALVSKYVVKARMERVKLLRLKFESIIEESVSRIGQQSAEKLKERFELLLSAQNASELSLRFREFKELSDNDVRVFVEGNSVLDELEKYLQDN